MGRKILKILAAFAFIFAGIALMVYPFTANYLFEHQQESIISTYDSAVNDAREDEISGMLAEAKEYNESLLNGNVQLHDPFTEEVGGYDEEDYYNLLSVDDSGIMGYVNIPCIDVNLPIYHGTSETVLETGVGHLEGSSLPIGGEGTHAVLTGHTGLSSAKLFTDLTMLEEGDLFFVTVLGEKIAYEVDQIKVVEPSDTSDLGIVNGEDYCTLLTCTPYGVNSHRLLVRGTRTEYTEELEEVAEAQTKEENSEWMSQYIKSLCAALALIVVSLVAMFILSLRKKHGRKQQKTERKEEQTDEKAAQQNPKKGRKSRISAFIGALIIIAGVGIYLYPNVRGLELEARTEKLINEFDEKYHDESEDYSELYEEMQLYNEDLAENGQELVDAWSYAQEPIDLTSLSDDDGAIGYIQIPAMDVTLPLYIGATTENMSKGAAVLSETSMPIGGEGTNCVIAGHRGYSGMPYFRDIEKLGIGDMVYITNPWETLTYQVSEISIIDPDDVESILIVPGRDMVTLLTCHPYMSNGKYRYVVYCERVEQTGDNQEETKDTISAGYGSLESSESLILIEQVLRIFIPVALSIFMVIWFIRRKKK